MRADWQPSAPLENLRQRASLLAQVRAFFAERGVLEVETPLLCQATVTDLHLDSLLVEMGSQNQKGQRRFLQTSPEFAMKRLLAAGSGPIYQLCKAFRRDESGSRHNPEFSMLEWYRPGMDEVQLMDEVESLLRACLLGDLLPADRFVRVTYRELFQQYLDLDPFVTASDELIHRACLIAGANISAMQLSRNGALDLLMSHAIEPQLQSPVFVTQFPASQAALARVVPDAEGADVAQRFELFVRGMEIANGYHELTDAQEQSRRFAEDNVRRARVGLPVHPVDERLLAAMRSGLPDCAGVALGFDRLMMLALNTARIADVISFTADHA